MPREGYSPPQLFLSYGSIAIGGLLFAQHPGMRALLILDWSRLFLLSLGALALLFLAERRLSRALRREWPDYPYRFSVLVVLFGLGVTLVGAVNGNFARSPPRVVRPLVRGWESTRHAAGPGVGFQPEGREPVIAIVESWRAPGETFRIPVSAEAQRQAQGPGPHVLEVIVPPGFLGVEYVEAVRLVTP